MSITNAAEEALRDLVANAAAAKQFALEQAPEIVQQLLTWALLKHSIYLAVGIGFLLGTVYLVKLFLRLRRSLHEKNRSYWTDPMAACFLASIVLGTPGFMMTLINALLVIKILVAPKLYLLQYAANLLK